MPTPERGELHAEEVTVEEELLMIEASDVEVTLTEPQSDWRYDPLDAQREEVGLRSLIGLVRDDTGIVLGGRTIFHDHPAAPPVQ